MYTIVVGKKVLVSKNINFKTSQNPENLENLPQEQIENYQISNYHINLPILTLYLSPLCVIIVWTIVLIIYQKIRSIGDNKTQIKNDISQKVPCRKCCYFHNNHYLKCAVNPKDVLTEEAINCCEFSPKQEKFTDKIRQRLWR